MKAKVLIRPKDGILDPQGKAVERALPALGFEGVSHVRVGRLVELETDDPDALADLCEKLLANPLIEDYEIELNGGARRGGSASSSFPGPATTATPSRHAGESARPDWYGTRKATWTGSTWSWSPEGSPTATTCERERSHGSRRRWRRSRAT